MKKLPHYALGAVWIMISVGCSDKSDPQAAIRQWNAVFGSKREACERGDVIACEETCRLSREKRICTTVAANVDLTNSEQRKWVDQCPARIARQALTACRKVAEKEKQAPFRAPSDAPAAPPPPSTPRPPQVSSPAPTEATTVNPAPSAPTGQPTMDGAASGVGQTASPGAPPSPTLSRETIQQVVGRHDGRIRMCYEQRLVGKPNLAGRMIVRFTVGGTGRVIAASAGESSLGDSALETCIVDVFRRMVFPAATNGSPVQISYPVVLTSKQ